MYGNSCALAFTSQIKRFCVCSFHLCETISAAQPSSSSLSVWTEALVRSALQKRKPFLKWQNPSKVKAPSVNCSKSLQ